MHRASLLALLVILVVIAPAARAKTEPARPATVQSQLTATPKEVHEALLQALSEWKLRKESLEEGIVKTEWVERSRGGATYRGRITAEFSLDGYQVLLSVKHEKQLKQAEMRPVLGGPAASWMDVDGDFELARAVVTSVERALGHEEDIVRIGERPPTSSRPIEQWDCFVSPSSAARIIDLKTRRRELVNEVKAMDAQILAAVYDGKIEGMKADVERVKGRKAEMESQITAIDREILQLVVAD